MSSSVALAREELRPAALDRATRLLYLITLALLPWAWFPPFPWLHEHAQWSDPVFAATAVCWAVTRWREHRWPRLGPAYLAIAGYLAVAAFSFLFSSNHEPAAAMKLLGMGELCMLAVITADLASDRRLLSKIAWVLAITGVVTSATAVCGLLLFYLGDSTPLIGIYGELAPSRYYARVQAGLYNPNLLASFCIFVAAVTGHRDADLPLWLKRATMTALWISVGLTFSRGIIGFAVAALIRHATTGPRRALAAACAAAGVAAMVSLSLCNITLDPTRPLQAGINRTTQSSRYQALTTSLQSIVSKPRLGTGPNTHPGRYLGNAFDSHMTCTGIAGTLGLPALAFFAWLISIAWLSRQRPTEPSIWGGMAGLALDGLGQDIESFRHLWVLTGLVLAYAGLRGTGIRRSGVSSLIEEGNGRTDWSEKAARISLPT